MTNSRISLIEAFNNKSVIKQIADLKDVNTSQDTAITTAQTTATAAQNTANTANTKADAAQTTADSALTQAQSALAVANQNATVLSKATPAQSDKITLYLIARNGTTLSTVELPEADMEDDTAGLYTKDLADAKIDDPETAGTAGQILALDSDLNPYWKNETGGTYTAGSGISISNNVISTLGLHIIWES